jgi:DNA-binding LacI/PurR family transcriptional regulator
LNDICLEGLDRRLAERDYRILVGISHGQPSLEDAYLAEFRARRVDAVILPAYDRSLACEGVLELVREGIPVVGIGHLQGMGISYVDVDRTAGVRRLVLHLVRDHGYREIAFFGADPEWPSIVQRLQGYRQALAEASVEFRDELVFDSEGSPSTEEDFTIGQRQIRECLDRLGHIPRSLFVSNDTRAIAVIRELNRRGYRVPEDVAVAGFDGIEIGSQLPVALTTVRQPMEQVTARAVEMAMKSIENGVPSTPDAAVLAPELVIRESCGCKCDTAGSSLPA